MISLSWTGWTGLTTSDNNHPTTGRPRLPCLHSQFHCGLRQLAQKLFHCITDVIGAGRFEKTVAVLDINARHTFGLKDGIQLLPFLNVPECDSRAVIQSEKRAVKELNGLTHRPVMQIEIQHLDQLRHNCRVRLFEIEPHGKLQRSGNGYSLSKSGYDGHRDPNRMFMTEPGITVQHW